MTILHVDSSINGDKSVSRMLSQNIVSHLTRNDPSVTIIRRDLAAAPLTHFSLADYADASFAEELLSASVIVVGAPMYNFAIPSNLKAWLDRLAIPGKTFRYSSNGPDGLAGGRKVLIASSRAGIFSEGSPMAALDHQETYLRAFFGFLGVTDVTFIRAEGVGMGEEMRQRAIEAAHEAVLKLAA